MTDGEPMHTAADQGVDLERGLPMFTASDPQALEQERAELAALAQKGLCARYRGYWSKTGPGFLQSAMTLGGGSAAASLFLGAYMQYDLLWVQPVAMLLGVIMLSAMSHQALCTGVRPFDALNRYIHPAVGWAWAIASLAATVIWHFPQYGLAAGMTADMISAGTGWQPTGGTETCLLLCIGGVVLVVSTAITWSYGSGRRGVRIYERALKALVWMIVAAFAVVVVRQTFAGRIEWGRVLAGFVPRRVPTDPRGFTVVMAALAAAVGINMTFLFPYTLLARGWGREHRGLSRFDLVTGMFLPYALATALMVIAAGSTMFDPEAYQAGRTMLSPVKAAGMIQAAGVGKLFARFIFGLGIVGMALSTITLHMLVSGFAVCEMFGVKPGGWRYKLACLIPAPGILGVVLWQKMSIWIAVPTSAVCGLLLPIAYIGFFILNNRRDYLGDDTPRGAKALLWNLGMLVSILVVMAYGLYYLYLKRGFFGIG